MSSRFTMIRNIFLQGSPQAQKAKKSDGGLTVVCMLVKIAINVCRALFSYIA